MQDEDIIGQFARYLHERQKSHDEAEAIFETALRMNPHHVGNLRAFSNLLADVGEYESALSKLREANTIEPKNGALVGDLAELCAHAGQSCSEEGEADEALFGEATKLFKVLCCAVSQSRSAPTLPARPSSAIQSSTDAYRKPSCWRRSLPSI